MKQYYIYLGTQTHKTSKGIYGMRISADGKLEEGPQLLAEQPSPTYFYVSRAHDFLYAVSEPGEEEKGLICVYAIDMQTQEISLHSKKVAAGRGLCHIEMDSAEQYAVVTCYEEATIQVYPVDMHRKLMPMFCLRRHIGSGPVAERQERAHAHSAFFTKDGAYVVICDLGMDTLALYEMNEETGKLHRAIGMNVKLPPGSGPRHMVMSPDGRYAYVACELSSEVAVLAYEKETGFTLIEQVSTLSPEFPSDRNYPAAIRLTQDGRCLYVSNRGEDSIALFKVNPQNGHISLQNTYSTRGWYPRDFILTGDERLLIAVNQLSDNMVIFRREPETGELTLTDEKTIVNAPVALIEG
ncbi:MAG: lactonase family protein [Lachnospiraceae bacterium]|jgi:6-phosphogluconolactonase|nr:lactonase family protein [Lachnospiraceae bacterium]